ncbi:Guanylate cyclase [Dirofilaria immitis]|nr:Guanylate cyclase [Dirofilaria immitis]
MEMLEDRNTDFNSPTDKKLDILGHTNDDKVLEITRDRIQLKLGHIGAAGTLSNEDKMLNVSLEDLYENGIIDEKLTSSKLFFSYFKKQSGDQYMHSISSRPGCGYSFEGAAVAAEMYYKQKIRAFIGPYCSSELDVVAKMATFWNTPVISYTATNGLIDKTIYRTLARVSFTNVNSIAEAVAALLAHYNWFKVQRRSDIASFWQAVASCEQKFFVLREIWLQSGKEIGGRQPPKLELIA